MTRTAVRLLLALILVLVPMRHGVAEVGDIEFKRETESPGDYPSATFPHWVHRMQFRCYVCHDDIFQMKAGSNAVTMAAIGEGKFCGTCHNGKVAFGVTFEACQRCHRP